MRLLVLALITVVLAVSFVSCGSSDGRKPVEKEAAAYYALP